MAAQLQRGMKNSASESRSGFGFLPKSPRFTTKRSRPRLSLILALVLTLLGGFAAVSLDMVPSAQAQTTPEGRVIEGKLARKQSLLKALKERGITSSMARPAIGAISSIFDFRTSRSGDGFQVYLDDEGQISSLRYTQSKNTYIAEKTEGRFVARKVKTEDLPPAPKPAEVAPKPNPDPKPAEVVEDPKPAEIVENPQPEAPTDVTPEPVDPQIEETPQTPEIAEAKPQLEERQPQPERAEETTKEADKPDEEEGSSFLTTALQVLFALAFLILIAWIAMQQRRRMSAGGALPSGGGMRTLQAVRIGDKHQVAMVSLKGKTYLVGLTPDRVTMLAALDATGDPIQLNDGIEADTAAALAAKVENRPLPKRPSRDNVSEHAQKEATWTGDPRSILSKPPSPPQEAPERSSGRPIQIPKVTKVKEPLPPEEATLPVEATAPLRQDPPALEEKASTPSLAPAVKTSSLAPKTKSTKPLLAPVRPEKTSKPQLKPSSSLAARPPATTGTDDDRENRESEAILARIAALRARHVKGSDRG